MPTLSVDFETRSTVELKRSGVHAYAVHRDTGIWCMAWAFDDDAPQLWWRGDAPPPEIVAHVAAGGEMRAWNAEFERVMWREVLAPQHGFPVPTLEQWHDTAAEAAAMALPRKLSHAATVLGTAQQKDDAGYRLMLQLCRPRRFTDAGEPVWWDTPEKLKRLGEYCRQDVRTERAIYHALRRLPAFERRVYVLDQVINDRGIALDHELALAAKGCATRELARQNAILAEATDGHVGEVTKIAKLKEWLAEQGLETESLNKAALRDLLADGNALSEPVRAALEARQEAGKSSVSKIDAMFDCVGQDGRMRGMLLYHGASTGRWAGRLVQPHNFPRGQDVDDVASYIPQVLEGKPTPLRVLSALLRSMLVAGPGRELVCADFTGIELRVLAWIVGQHDLVDALVAGRKIYHEMGGVIFHKPATEIVKPSDEYTVAKNTVLGCGFGMGAEKFRDQLEAQAGVTIAPELAETAVQAYRTGFPRVPDYWSALNSAALDAVARPGEVVAVNHVKFTKRGAYLWLRLPSGRFLAYPAPKIVDRTTPWGEVRPAVEFSGVNSYTRQWERMALYGGLLTENVVSATARDLLAEAMLRVEAAGFPVVLTVHDEIVSEVPEAQADLPRFLQLMKTVPPWAAGCPVDAEGWHGHRYRK